MEKLLKKTTASDGRDRPKKPAKPVFDRTIVPPAGLVAKDPPPQPKLKHQAYFEFVENTNKKKQLEYKVIADREPPPGFTFVPNGMPELTKSCKEISREKDAMIFIVSTARDNTNELSMHTSRIGYHIREAIVEEAQAALGYRYDLLHSTNDGVPEPIPETQEGINAQADAALRELFPRIPNTDRQEIVDHAFRKREKPVVGLSNDLTLSRRVQLAVLAHIRHRHTRYDSLLKETTWQHARKTVEAVCLDIIVKWRGDEENGRDTLDSILREVVVISDSEGEDDSDDEDSDDVILISPRSIGPGQRGANASTVPGAVALENVDRPRHARNASTTAPKTPRRKTPATPGNAKRAAAKALRRERKVAKKAQRGFKRYQAAWEQAVDRNRHGQEVEDAPLSAGLATQRSPGYDPYAPTCPDHDARAQPPQRPGHVHSNSNVIYLGPARRPETTNPGFTQVDGQYPAGPPSITLDGQISPRPVQPRVGEERAPMMTRSLTNPSLPVGRSHGPNYQDLLVPSIEGPSPSAMGPQFVRPLPSRKRARDESPEHSAGYPPSQHFPLPYPAEPVQDGQVKRRRVVTDRDGMAVPHSGPYTRSPPHYHGPIQREPEARHPVSYHPLDPSQGLQDPHPAQVYYERQPQPVEAREPPAIARQPNVVASSRGSEIIELRRGVQEPPSYRNYHRAEPIPVSPREYRDAPVPSAAHHLDRYDQPPLATHYPVYEYPSGPHQTQQVQRPSAQPIFVRTVEPRTVEAQPRGGTRNNRYAAPGDGIPAQRREELPAQYARRGRSLEPFYEVNRQPAFAPLAHGVPTTRPFLQEPIRMEPQRQQAHPPVLPYAGHERPPGPPPRDVFVYD